jgi:hypothetical protein
VRNGDELLALVLESLHRAQEALGVHDTPEARFLWDEHSRRPKDESAVSDWVKNFLQRDLKDSGVIAAREVEIYKRIGAPRGASTDIHIDVSSQARDGSREQVKVIVEVKGPWNPELKSAMKTQLLEDYLTNSDARHGIYLSSWFPLDQWTQEDYRRSRVPFVKKGEMATYLDQQARDLSTAAVAIKSFVLDCALPSRPTE